MLPILCPSSKLIAKKWAVKFFLPKFGGALNKVHFRWKCKITVTELGMLWTILEYNLLSHVIFGFYTVIRLLLVHQISPENVTPHLGLPKKCSINQYDRYYHLHSLSTIVNGLPNLWSKSCKHIYSTTWVD